MPYGTCLAQGDNYNNDLIIEGDEIYIIEDNDNVHVEGNIIVKENAKLIISNSEVIMDSSSDGELEIIVNGELNIDRSTIKAANSEYGYSVIYNEGSAGRIQDSVIEDIGYYSPGQLIPGLLIRSTDIYVEGNVFRHCRGTCIWGRASNLRIENNLFEETWQGGIMIGTPDEPCTNVIIANNTFIRLASLSHSLDEICTCGDDDGIGIGFQNSDGEIIGNFLTEARCSAIELDRGSKVEIYKNKITKNLDWAIQIHDPGTEAFIHDNFIRDIYLRDAIWVYNEASATIKNNNISDVNIAQRRKIYTGVAIATGTIVVVGGTTLVYLRKRRRRHSLRS